MPIEVAINVNSLRMIREELSATIDAAATDFEAFILDQSDRAAIAACREKLVQTGGTLRLLQYPGAALLGDEMAELAKAIESAEGRVSEPMMNALTQAFFILPRYLEYILGRQSSLPILLIPSINELRVSRRVPLYPEYHFCPELVPVPDIIAIAEKAPNWEQLVATGKRLHHMYQAGLLGVLKEGRLQPHCLLLHRAVCRIRHLLGSHPAAQLWLMAEAVLECFANGGLELNFNRKRLLADIEKRLRETVTGNDEVVQNDATTLHKGLAFLLMLSPYQSELVNRVRKALSPASLPCSDADLSLERDKMRGPNVETIESVIKVLHEELRGAKDILEIGSQNNGIDGDDLSNLKTILLRVADTLSVLNLTGPRNTLKDQLQKVESWAGNQNVSTLEFLEVADAVLFVESSLSGLDRHETTVQELNQANELTRKTVIANSHLAEAERVVIDEAQAGISLAKRAITAYVDSSFDPAHIANLAVTLSSVRGGLQVLRYKRAAAILKCCSEFINEHMKNTNMSDQRHQLLETLADALISLEYYLGEVATSRSVNDKILDVAEESLAALGFKAEYEK